jgi:hypothetical protein
MAKTVEAALVIAIVGLGGSCNPTFHFDGSVERPNGAKVAGASVSITCRGLDEGKVEAAADENGKFSTTKAGSVRRDCPIDVLAWSEPARHFSSAQYCVDWGATRAMRSKRRLSFRPRVLLE